MGVRSLRAVGTWTKEGGGRGRRRLGSCGGVATRDCWRYIDQLLYRASRYFHDIKYNTLGGAIPAVKSSSTNYMMLMFPKTLRHLISYFYC